MGGTATQLATEDRAKTLGAYYTDSQVADFLVRWALRGPKDRVLDPSFGGGVFLRAASKRLSELDGSPCTQVFGVELDGSVHHDIAGLLKDEFRIEGGSLRLSDFFEVGPSDFPTMDAVVGNPPFIRYQRFAGDTRAHALNRAAEAGVKLSSLTSSWAPFLVHSVRFLRPGGRLAMVIPFEIGHAAYARPALRFLGERFRAVTFLTFQKRLFSDLSEDTLLLLAEGCKPPGRLGRFRIRDLGHGGELSALLKDSATRVPRLRQLNAERISSGEDRLIEALIPARARDLYRELRESQISKPLRDYADVGIGYVTGANDFFHLSREASEEWKIPKRFLRPSVRRGRALSGLIFRTEDWKSLLGGGNAGYLLDLSSDATLPSSVKKYLEHGRRKNVHRAFKCRTRTPWYRVPHIHQPDGLLTYMSGGIPRLVANDANVVAPNSLHVVRLHKGGGATSAMLAALWQTSLTQLSVEIEGHALGGGMLKLEPTEAERVLLPHLEAGQKYSGWAEQLDEIVRRDGQTAATALADELILSGQLGLMMSDVKMLRDAASSLRNRRIQRSRK